MILPKRNLLADETSPYLRQHCTNPVHWRGWSAQTLEEAQSLDRPILLSVGYAACHWCHVMAHESFENEAIAAVMNRLFVNIKVDREERPDIDQIYMAALSAMGEQGGWPLTMFLTPDAKPFWGGTYFPPTPRYGRPGFVQVLEAVGKAWSEKRQDLMQSSDALTSHVHSRLAGDHASGQLDITALAKLAGAIHDMVDKETGGLRGAPKFPNAPFMHTLWLSWLRDGDENHRQDVLTSLERMLSGGIYDHIGGGLSRYSTDSDWLVPHFEKMLYDNAQLLRLCNWAHVESHNELFRIRIEETVAWLIKEMRTKSGAFTSSLDADSNGEEGSFYTWTAEQVNETLQADSDLFFQYFTLTKPTSWEGNPIVHQTATQSTQALIAHDLLTPIRHRLRMARDTRIAPARDDKVLTDWNGLVIAALAECGRAFDNPEWVTAAVDAFDHILRSRRDGRLPHSMLGEKSLFPALSSDYAAMINAAISLYEATRDANYIAHAEEFLEQLNIWHCDAVATGYYLTASDSTDIPIRIRGDVDEAIPSATSQIIEAFARLAAITGSITLHETSISVAEHAAGRAAQQAYGQAGIVNACALVNESQKLIIVDDLENPCLVPVANRIPDPRRVDHVIDLGKPSKLTALPDGTIPPTNQIGAYLCSGMTCRPRVTDPDELERMLRRT